MPDLQQGMRSTWSEAWCLRGFRRALIFGTVLLLSLAAALPYYFAFIESKPGLQLYDPVLMSIGPIDVSKVTFGVLYALILAGIFQLLRSPYRFVRMIHAYALLLVLRMITMFVITLEPPATIIPLVDPVTQIFYPADEPFLKDLFFSGHTGTSVLFALAAGSCIWRRLFTAGALVVGLLVIVQHVHYTIDVLAAPFFATIAWAAAKYVMDLSGVKAEGRSL